MLARRFVLCALSAFMFATLVASAPQKLHAQVNGANGSGGFVEPKNPQSPQFGGWYLGVYGTYTLTGLYLTQVYPGTAAWNVGLEVGDRIVAVNGRRISMNYPLDVALQSTRTGWVQLLVEDRRTGRIVGVPVRLTRSRIHY